MFRVILKTCDFQMVIYQCNLLVQQVDTPDSVLQSGLGLTPDNGLTVLRSMVDPRDYERLKYLRINGCQNNSFEETIHRVRLMRLSCL